MRHNRQAVEALPPMVLARGHHGCGIGRLAVPRASRNSAHALRSIAERRSYHGRPPLHRHAIVQSPQAICSISHAVPSIPAHRSQHHHLQYPSQHISVSQQRASSLQALASAGCSSTGRDLQHPSQHIAPGRPKQHPSPPVWLALPAP